MVERLNGVMANGGQCRILLPYIARAILFHRMRYVRRFSFGLRPAWPRLSILFHYSLSIACTYVTEVNPAREGSGHDDFMQRFINDFTTTLVIVLYTVFNG